MQSVHQRDAQIYKAFCDENRLAILAMLRDGEKCACILLEQLHIGQPTLSHHMKILVDSGIVESRKEGKWTHYRISEEGSMRALLRLRELTATHTSASGSIDKA